MLIAAGAGAAYGADGNLLKEYDRKIRLQSAMLDSIKNELDKGREKLSQLARQEGTHVEQLALLEKNMAIAGRYLEEIAAKIDTTNRRIGLLRDSLDGTAAALARRQEMMARRLRTMYKTGRPGRVEVVISSKSLIDMLNRLKYFQELENYDQELLRSIDSARMVLAGHTAALEEQAGQLAALKSVKEAEQEKLRAEQAGHTEMLTKVRREREAYERMVKELEEAQQELSLLLKTLQQKRTKVKTDYERSRLAAFDKRRGKLPWPVDGSVVRPFGKIVHPVYKTVTMNTGIDIAARKGAAVVCVAPGRVDYVGWMRGYGRFVIVNHDGGFITIYAHLDNIAVSVGQEVSFGTAIGVVAEGDVESGARLHFQIRSGTEPVDPQQWLEIKQ